MFLSVQLFDQPTLTTSDQFAKISKGRLLPIRSFRTHKDPSIILRSLQTLEFLRSTWGPSGLLQGAQRKILQLQYCSCKIFLCAPCRRPEGPQVDLRNSRVWRDLRMIEGSLWVLKDLMGNKRPLDIFANWSEVVKVGWSNNWTERNIINAI